MTLKSCIISYLLLRKLTISKAISFGDFLINGIRGNKTTVK